MPTIAQALQLGSKYQQAGLFQQAEQLYRQILQADPQHLDALYQLGALAHRRGQNDLALQCISQVVQRVPTFAEAHNNLGNVLQDQGRLEEATASYRRALHLRPDYPAAHYHLGTVFKDQGQWDEAAACFRQALDLHPDFAEAWNNLGLALQVQGKRAEAATHFQQAVRLKPDYAEAYNNLGNSYQQQGKLTEAVNCWQQALQLRPDFAEVFKNLGLALVDQGESARAVACLQQALCLQPNDPTVHNHLGIAHKALGNLAEAEACLQRALSLQPRCVEAHNNLGNVFVAQGKLEEAVQCYRQALGVQPDYAEAHCHLGLARKEQGRLTEATASFEEALHLRPDYAEARTGLALTWLLAGKLEQGWAAYEWRWQCKGFAQRSADAQRRLWDGAPLRGQTILLQAEQGLGDSLQFVRYAPLVRQRGGRVLLACPTPLLRLLTGCPGIDQVISLDGPLPPCDVLAPLLSLPRLFGTSLATIPATVPYLRADPELVEHWRRELREVSGFRIGIAWQGNPRHPSDRQRSLPLACFEELAKLPRVRLVSLQKGPGIEQLDNLGDRFPVVALGQRFSDLADTAAAMMNLDLVVTVDTALAHLAGALGGPVWVALPYAPDWRWLLEREDSPWYPSMHLFRQQRWGDWAHVFTRIEEALRASLAGALP